MGRINSKTAAASQLQQHLINDHGVPFGGTTASKEALVKLHHWMSRRDQYRMTASDLEKIAAWTDAYTFPVEPRHQLTSYELVELLRRLLPAIVTAATPAPGKAMPTRRRKPIPTPRGAKTPPDRVALQQMRVELQDMLDEMEESS